MTAMLDETRELWLWLHQRGGKWTARQIAQHKGGDSQQIFRRLNAMCERQLVAKYPPESGDRYLRYAVTGTCLVPVGMCVAEVQEA